MHTCMHTYIHTCTQIQPKTLRDERCIRKFSCWKIVELKPKIGWMPQLKACSKRHKQTYKYIQIYVITEMDLIRCLMAHGGMPTSIRSTISMIFWKSKPSSPSASSVSSTVTSICDQNKIAKWSHLMTWAWLTGLNDFHKWGYFMDTILLIITWKREKNQKNVEIFWK